LSAGISGSKRMRLQMLCDCARRDANRLQCHQPLRFGFLNAAPQQ
jgi:hypothetical protein